jgi:4-phytase/acid phosphatase
MNLFKRKVILLGLVLTVTAALGVQVDAQTIIANDNTVLKQIIVFGRHSIRSSTVDPSVLNTYAVTPYPPFEVQPGYLTPNGRQAEALLGSYFRQYLLQEGLLTGNNQTDAAHSYFRSNSIERSYETAAAFQGGLIPNSTQGVHSYPLGQLDPVFDPIGTGVVQQLDVNRAVMEAQALFNNGTALASAYSGEYSLIRSTLFDYPLGTQPPPLKPSSPADLVDVTAIPITLTASAPPYYTGSVINPGGLEVVSNAVDPFVMQYCDNFDLDQVAWGRLTLDQIAQNTRIQRAVFEIEVLSPYVDRVQSSNAASHILQTMTQVVNGGNAFGAFCSNKSSRAVVVISSDGYVAGLAGLLNVHWQLPGYQPNFCAPGGALVFELRQSKSTKKYLVRVYYTAQTFDQLRNLRPLSLDVPPATIQLLVPGGSTSSTNPDVDFGVFQKLMQNAIGQQYVQNPLEEVPPGVLTFSTE